jgi:hypothetical protein
MKGEANPILTCSGFEASKPNCPTDTSQRKAENHDYPTNLNG